MKGNVYSAMQKLHYLFEVMYHRMSYDYMSQEGHWLCYCGLIFQYSALDTDMEENHTIPLLRFQTEDFFNMK